MRIGQRLSIGFIAIVLLMGVVGGVAIKYTINIRSDAEMIAISSINEVEGATEVAYHIQRIKSNIRELFLETIEGRPEEIKIAKAKIKESVFEIEKYSSVWEDAINAGIKLAEEEEEEELEEFKKLKINEFVALVNKTMELYEKEGYEEADEYFEDDVEPLARELKEAVREREEETEEEIINRANEIVAFVKNTMRLIVIVTIIALLLAIVLGYIISRSITNPITKLKDAAVDIAQGNMDAKIEVKPGDEIGELAEAFDNMRTSLKVVMEEYEKKEKKE